MRSIRCAQVNLGWVDKSCKTVFDVLSVILCGEPAQLPQVTDKQLYNYKPTKSLGEQGYNVYRIFGVIKLNFSQRLQNTNHKKVKLRDLLCHDYQSASYPIFLVCPNLRMQLDCSTVLKM